MKKSIFLLALLLSIDVHATNTYTEYEHVGYTFEEKSDDELYKYERVTLNKFYRELESEVEYLEEGTNLEKSIDKTDYKTVTFITTEKPDDHEYDQLITIRSEDNYIANKLIIEVSDYEYAKIAEIEIYNEDEKIHTSCDVEKMIDGDIKTYEVLKTERFEIVFGSYTYINNLKVKIYFESERPININYTINKTSGLYKIDEQLTLDNEAKSIIINSLKDDKYGAFLEENSFEEKDITYYYGHDKILYKHYIPLKEYHMITEAKEIEGYTYDEEESYDMYKVYHREKIEKPKETIIEIPSEPEKIIEYVMIRESIPCDCENTECEIEQTIEKDTYPAVLDTTKNEESITNLEVLKSETKENTEECETKPNWWLITGISFLIISLILTIMYYINVKRQEE